ncbi:GerMN domain-containing protein [Candidatus Poribacteria bacterium]|nr:GerMN domain-containing protein [Candidatus Poribacteria bacterium]
MSIVDSKCLEQRVSLVRRVLRSRLFLIWGFTLVGIIIALAVTLLLIAKSKQTEISKAPPKLPESKNQSDVRLQTEQVNIFLLDPESLEVKPIKVEVKLSREPIDRLKSIVDTLTKETPTNYRNPIPRGTVLNEVFIDTQKTVYLDFSHHLTDGHIGGTMAEYITISAILKTVFDNFPDEIRHIQLLVEGQEIETLTGHVNLSAPMRF